MPSGVCVTFIANIAAIVGASVTVVGAIIGVVEYWKYRRSTRKKTQALVEYLKKKKDEATEGKKGQQTATHLVRYVGLTYDEILRISFDNRRIARIVSKDEQGKADTLYFEYREQ